MQGRTLFAYALILAAALPGCMTANKIPKIPLLPRDVSNLATMDSVGVQAKGTTLSVSGTDGYVPQGGTLIFSFHLTQLGVDNGTRKIDLRFDAEPRLWTGVFRSLGRSREARISVSTAHLGLGRHVISMRLYDAGGQLPNAVDKVAAIIVVPSSTQP